LTQVNAERAVDQFEIVRADGRDDRAAARRPQQPIAFEHVQVDRRQESQATRPWNDATRARQLDIATPGIRGYW
jgi:hypothetical protein